MLICDKKTMHAMEAMLTIASHTGMQPISGKEIAAKHNLPPRYLEQMLQRLVRGELLRGVRGPRGGYVLAREKRRISLVHIIQAVEDPDTYKVTRINHALSATLENLQNAAYRKLEAITLQDLVPEDNTQKHKETYFAI